jgi:hypothetical protein
MSGPSAFIPPRACESEFRAPVGRHLLRYDASYLPGIDQLRNADHLGAAPDFFGYFRAHPEDIADAVHPNLAGYAAMAELWGVALAG